MKIIIAGAGKVGKNLAEQLSIENHDIVLIDKDIVKLENPSNQIDIQILHGNSATVEILKEAGIADCDLFLAVTSNDEVNLLCCFLAQKMGAKHNVARVRNPEYTAQLGFMRKELGLSMYINPERIAADEISRILRAPSALKIDVFSRGRVEIVKIRVKEGGIFDNIKLSDLQSAFNKKLLVCAIERGEDVIIPSGNNVLHAEDKISIIVPASDVSEIFKKAGFINAQIKRVMIVGGGVTGVFLARQLLKMHINVKIIEKDINRCHQLAELLPDAIVVCGDGTEHTFLENEGILRTDAVISLMNIDEENIILSMYAASKSNAKVVTKINRPDFVSMAKNLNVGSVISPKSLTAQIILRYVRAVQNSVGTNMENLYRIVDDKVEALEFWLNNKDAIYLNRPLKELALKNGVLVACIIRNGKVIIPNGDEKLIYDDHAVVVTMSAGFQDFSDIFI